jgi:hypothetical protein
MWLVAAGMTMLLAVVFGGFLATAGAGHAASIALRQRQTAGSTAATGAALGQQTAQYPSMVRLQYSGEANGTILATYTSFVGNRAEDPIFASIDGGKTFAQIATLDPSGSKGLCCTSLYELPRQLGALPAGTVLWAAAKDDGARPMSLPVWKSEDHGLTWSYLSTCATSPNKGGLWEPELSLDGSGRLNCYFSDESNSAHSQMLARTVSPDGVHWGPGQQVVALPDRAARPGMAVVRPLPDGKYFMTYELCGTTGPACQVHYRVSANGQDWGNPATPGAGIVGPNGRIPEHTPKFTVTPAGLIVLASQTYNNPNGSPAPGNGATLLTNGSAGAGTWSQIPAPVSAPDTAKPLGPCINYSPALVPADQNRVLEVTTIQQANNTCRAYYGSEPSK